MGGDVRTTVGVPKLSAFANGSGTPLVIDTATGVGYFTDKNTVVPITGGGASGVTSVNGETGVVVIDAADVGALPLAGGTLTGPLQLNDDLTMGAGTAANVEVLRVYDNALMSLIKSDTGNDAIVIAAGGSVTFPNSPQLPQLSGPVFLAAKTTVQSLPKNVSTKIIYNSEVFDTNVCYDPVLSRFTPNVAGIYQIIALAAIQTTTTTDALSLEVHKNGSPYVYSTTSVAAPGAYPTAIATTLVLMNGTTDYIEVFAYPVVTAATVSTPADPLFFEFSGFFIRAL